MQPGNRREDEQRSGLARILLTTSGATSRAHARSTPSAGPAPPASVSPPSVGQLAARRFIRGTSPTTFEPSNPVLRAQVAALIGRTLGFTAAPPAGNPFPDRCDPANPSNCIDDEL